MLPHISLTIDCLLANPRRVKLPAFTLQPLVENAFIHGLEPKVTGGTVTISVKELNGNIIIKVSDDGIGMNADQLRAVRRQQPRAGETVSPAIGLANVRERLRLFTGDRHCFTIKSTPILGTTMTIILRKA